MGTADIDDQDSHDSALRATAATSPDEGKLRHSRRSGVLGSGESGVRAAASQLCLHMRVLLQRVTRAEVRVDGRVTGRIGRGYLLLVGITHDDDAARLVWMADKIAGLRLFADAEGKMNLALADVGGAVLVVSQFTLYGDASRGRRPSFIAAARPEVAIPLYERFIALLRERGLTVETGEFGASMEVDLINDGPVTLPLEC
jgi:D-tyrosyl-tRNA(Tyr) deacylase